jgi:hypothetical protein
MRARTGVLAGTVALAAVTAAATPANAKSAAHHRGDIVSTVDLGDQDAAATTAYLADHGLPAPAARYGTHAYRLVYRTVDPHGKSTTASGLVMLPDRGQRVLRAVAFEHGTMANRAYAPSVDPDGRSEATYFTAAGYAAVAPDYLGLGVGPGRHPYSHIASETTASVDMLVAARSFAGRHRHALDRRLLISGFSQGGPAAMALGRAIQGGADRHFRVAGLAPISGPYDVEHAELPVGLFGDSLDPPTMVYLFAYWLTSMNRLYPIYHRPSEAFQAPYDTIVDGLYDGSHTDTEIVTKLPATPRQLLTPAFVAWAAHPTGALLEALRATDGSCDWRPKTPVRLWAAHGDRTVAFLDSQHCVADLAAHGVRAPLTDLGDILHSPSKKAALPQILTYFQQHAAA